MSKRLLLLALIFGCQLLVNCEPKTMTKMTQKPGYYSRNTVLYDGPYNNLKPGGFSTKPQLQPFSRLNSLLRKLEGNGLNSPLMPGRQPFGLVSPPKYGRQGSDSSLGPFSDTIEWSKQKHKILDDLSQSILKDISNYRQGVGGMKRKPMQVTGYGRDEGDGGSPKVGGWPRVGENSPGTRRNGAQNGGASGSRTAKFHQECLDVHNVYRKKHGVPPLTLNEEISLISQRWAQHLANRGSVMGIYHSDSKFRKGYGENIYASKGYTVTGRTAVDNWYDEIKDYDFRTGTSITGEQIGHLTQLLWKTSKKMGVGYATSSNGAIFVVCHYNPAGNVVGQITKNVPPIGGLSEEDVRRQAEGDARRRQMMFGPMQFFFDHY